MEGPPCFSCGKKARHTCQACVLNLCKPCEKNHWRDCELRPDASDKLVFPLSVRVVSAVVEFQHSESLDEHHSGIALAQMEWASGGSTFLWSYSKENGLVLEYEQTHPADLKRKHYLTFSGFAIALLHVKKRHQEENNEGRNEFGITSAHRAAFRGSYQSENDLLDGFGRSVVHWAAMGGKLDNFSLKASADTLWALPIHYWVWAGFLQSGDKFGSQVARENVGRAILGGRSMVHLAVLGGSSREILLQLVGDRKELLEMPDSSRMLPIHEAIRMRNADLVTFFLERRGSKLLPIFEQDPFGNMLNVSGAVAHLREAKIACLGISVFAFACCHSSLDVVDVVMSATTDVDVFLAFLLVCCVGKLQVANLLVPKIKQLRSCPEVMVREARGSVPSKSKLIAWACTYRLSMELVNLLIGVSLLDAEDLNIHLAKLVMNSMDVEKWSLLMSLMPVTEIDAEILHTVAARDDLIFLKYLLRNYKEAAHPATKDLFYIQLVQLEPVMLPNGFIQSKD